MKRYFLSIIMCLGFILLEGQVTLVKDYFRNGSRVVELNYKGVDYSLIMQNFNREREARLFFENLVRRKPLVLHLEERSQEVFNMSFGGETLLSAVIKEGSVKIDENSLDLSQEDIMDLNAFSEIYTEVKKTWPFVDPVDKDAVLDSGPGSDGILVEKDWKFIGITAGGSLSIASARCGFMHNEIEIGEGCFATTDCSCIHGSFLCVCVCGLICDQ